MAERLIYGAARRCWRAAQTIDWLGSKLADAAWHAHHRAERRSDLAWGGRAWTGEWAPF